MCKAGRARPAKHTRMELSWKVTLRGIVTYMSDIDVDQELK